MMDTSKGQQSPTLMIRTSLRDAKQQWATGQSEMRHAMPGVSPTTREVTMMALQPPTLRRNHHEGRRQRDAAAWLWHERSLRSTEMRTRRIDYNYLMQTLTIFNMGERGNCLRSRTQSRLDFYPSEKPLKLCHFSLVCVCVRFFVFF